MRSIQKTILPVGVKKAVSKEVFIFLFLFLGLFGLLCWEMGTVNMFNTMMNTAYALLLETVFYIMAIAVLAGAISALFSEFGVISLLNKLLSKVIELIYGLPGASAVGVFTTYLSDNPAILTLANDNNFRRYFKKYQLPALCNIGTAFGMGLIITTFMAGLKSPTGESFGVAVLIGNLGAVVGSIVSTRLMLWRTSKIYGKEKYHDGYALEYFKRGNARAKMHPDTADILENWLTMLAEKGEKETFAYIKAVPNDQKY